MQHGNRILELAQACIHCGLCLEACPTWQLTGREDFSPRGRIRAVVGATRGEVSVPQVLPALDACLGCRACETACPSGVRYGELLEVARAEVLEPARPWSWRRLVWRPLIRHVLPHRHRFGLLLWPVRVLARLGWRARLPFVGRLVGMLPPPSSATRKFTGGVPGSGARRAVLLEGCAMPVVYPGVLRASERLLESAGFRVERATSGCCGALEAHDGARERAMGRVRRVLEGLVERDVVITEAAGCGAHLKAHRASRHPEVLDLSEALLTAGWTPRRPLEGAEGGPLRVAYQDPCHLLHGQGLQGPARELLERAGATVLPVADAGRCCGGAGTHAFLQPQAADRLGQAKWDDLVRSAPEVIVTSNPSCQMQLEAARRHNGGRPEILHLAEVLARTL